MKKAAFFIAFKGFRDEEYSEPKKILEENNIKVTTVSTSKGKAEGKFKMMVDVDLTIDEIKPNDYDILVLIGGPGALEYLDNPQVRKIFLDFYNNQKPVAAICISPVILAHAGILKNKKATVWPDGKDELIKSGALYTGNPVEVDSKIITANGPQAAKDFANKIVEILK
ncbi:MAG: DJ-1/PfpI family protein [Elusimicrobiales bacterium]|nr:DJ-1/PfpI family protein [Elusimicrobiales bacterium]